MGTGSSRITARGLTKHYGSTRAVESLDFDVRPGRITGFLGPNGSGKSTTLRLLLGLQAPTAGWATIAGKQYKDLKRPLKVVGAALEGDAFARYRTGRDHLRCWAPLAGVPRERVDQLLALVGLENAATARVGTYSLGMKQRLALATALLGDPEILVLDEPANGLDPEGILWLRSLLRDFAQEGRTVLVSSHQLGEMQRMVDDVLLIREGHLLYGGALTDLLTSENRHADQLAVPWGAEVSETVVSKDLEAAYFDLTRVASNQPLVGATSRRA